MKTRAAITGWGQYIPARVLTNKDLEKKVDTNDEWIRTRTGIRERRLAETGETTVSMGALAAQRALEHAHLAAADLDLIICATTTPDYMLPASACLIQQKIHATSAGAFDLNTACTGFLYGLTVASQFIEAGTYRRILVVAAETLSRFIDWTDRNTCVLFGDGASAVVLEATRQDAGVQSSVLGSRGDLDQLLTIEAGGCCKPASVETLANRSHFVRMRGNDIFKLAVRSMAQASLQAVEKVGLKLEDMRAVIPHQANLRIITATQEALGLPLEKFFIDIERLGNTGAASVPLALVDYLSTHEVEAGDHLLLVSFGGGLTWAATVVRWGDVPALIRERRRAA